MTRAEVLAELTRQQQRLDQLEAEQADLNNRLDRIEGTTK